jgi:hypothetical protein
MLIITMIVLSIITIAATASLDLFAQNKTTTSTTITGQPKAGVVNQTTIPAQQTNVTVEHTKEPVPQGALQSVGNVSSGPATNLTELGNQTLVKPTGPATTTTINATQIPFNQTILEIENQTESQQQQQQSNQTQSQQQSENQSGKGPLEQMGEAISKTFGGK